MNQIDTMHPSPLASGARLLAAAAVAILAGCGKPPAAPAAAAPPEIEVVTLAAETIALPRTYVGRTTTRRTVELRARVTGTLAERPFTEGSMVKEGAVLFRLDPREFEAAVASAKARQAQAGAHLRQTQQDLARIEPLAQSGMVAAQSLDTAKSAVDQAEPDVKAADAAVMTAELQLAYATITAPFDGRIGSATRDVGATVGPGDGTLAVLDGVDPLLVEYTVSEREMAELRQMMDNGQLVRVDLSHLVARAVLVDGSLYPEEGRIDYTDVRVNPETGMSMIRAEFPNPKGRLLPGQFVRVRVEGLSRPAAIALPQSAVMQSTMGSTAYVVGSDDVIANRPIRVGAWTADGKWIVEDGLKAGERVVVSSVMKVRPAMRITPIAPAPPAPAAPAPAAPSADGQSK